jgi:TPR repeat protein
MERKTLPSIKSERRFSNISNIGDNFGGSCLEHGKGAEVDLISATEFYKRAADQGSANGQYRYGCCLEKGKGVQLDRISAAAFFKKSADQGNAAGQFASGFCLAHGKCAVVVSGRILQEVS